MKIQWTSHIDDPEAKERFRNHIIGSKDILERLQTLIEDRERAISSIETGVEIYRQPGWDALLAHYNGEKASLRYIKQLITLDQKDTDYGRDPA